MKRLRFYLETSVFGVLSDPEPSAQRESTLYFLDVASFRNVELYSSLVTLYDLDVAPARVRQVAEARYSALEGFLEETEESDLIADALVAYGVFSRKQGPEARHVAIAAAFGLDAVVSWDFHGMVNMQCRRGVQAVCSLLGFRAPDLVSPEEALRED